MMVFVLVRRGRTSVTVSDPGGESRALAAFPVKLHSRDRSNRGLAGPTRRCCCHFARRLGINSVDLSEVDQSVCLAVE